MKKFSLLVFIFLASASILKAQYVYKTPSGQKYHLGSCHMVKNVSEKITIAQGQNSGLEACKICKPTSSATNLVTAKSQTARGQSNTVQCNGTTKKGSRCQHMTSIANGFCFQHGPNK